VNSAESQWARIKRRYSSRYKVLERIRMKAFYLLEVNVNHEEPMIFHLMNFKKAESGGWHT
jgi:hypothetical protein